MREVSVVIVGAGFMGRTHAGAYGKISGAKLLGICDISEKARLEFSAEYGVKAYSSYDEVLSDESCDAVDICLPTALHEEYVMSAIDAGKAVFCDVDKAHIARQIMAIRLMNKMDMCYIRFFLQANFHYLKKQGQGVIPGIDRKSVLSMAFPLPPLAEQKRIVEKLEELLVMCERLKE